ncbi:MAG TPA: phosphopantetheine-binding protein [Opitutaceae bacterium]|nr:phosphopantetheine-binding protein [Opitutaceae bacterium]
MSDPLRSRLKTLIVETLRLDDVRAEDIPDDEPLFGSPRFGLDSIDALELVVRLEKEFGVKIGSSEESRRALASVASLAAYIQTSRPATES